MTDIDGATFEQTIRINARRETVWKYWTDPERLCAWWGAAAELEPHAGGICRVEMDNGNVMRGEYLELEPHDRLVFSFGWEARDDGPSMAPGESRVEVTLIDDAGDTILTLRHTGIPAVFAELHAFGWSRYLPLLAGAAA